MAAPSLGQSRLRLAIGPPHRGQPGAPKAAPLPLRRPRFGHRSVRFTPYRDVVLAVAGKWAAAPGRQAALKGHAGQLRHPDLIGGHSLRAGFATQAGRNKASVSAIMAQTGAPLPRDRLPTTGRASRGQRSHRHGPVARGWSLAAAVVPGQGVMPMLAEEGCG